MEAAGDRSALDDGVLGQVFEGEQGAALFEVVDQFMGHFAVVEAVGIGPDAGKSAGQLGLTEGFALLIKMAVALEDALRVGEAGQVGVGELPGFFGGELEALLGKLDGRSEDAAEAELPVPALGVDQAGHRAGGGDGAVADHTQVGDHVALGVLVHGFGGIERGLLAEVDEGGLAVMGAEEEKAAAAQVAGRRMHHCQGKAGGHGGVHGVAALAQEFKAGVGGEVVDADHHSMPRALGLLGKVGSGVGNPVHRALLGDGWSGGRERGADQGSQDGEKRPSIHGCGDRITRKGRTVRRFLLSQVKSESWGARLPVFHPCGRKEIFH